MPRVSLNEIEGIARKAARGAGMSWGLAEEAGKTARWLALHEIESLAPLIDMLDARDGATHEALRPREDRAQDGAIIWRAADGPLCPVAAGTALADLAYELTAPGAPALRLLDVLAPVLLLPFLARAAAASGHGFEIAVADRRVAVDRHGPIDPPGPLPPRANATVTPITGPIRAAPPIPAARGVDVDAAVWTRADAYARRTYVPASEDSRLSGAGAGLSDND